MEGVFGGVEDVGKVACGHDAGEEDTAVEVV